jgi:hypothetical protein
LRQHDPVNEVLLHPTVTQDLEEVHGWLRDDLVVVVRMLLDLYLLELLHHLFVVAEGHIRIQSEHGLLQTLVLGLLMAETSTTYENGCGWVILKKVVDVVLVLVLLSVLLERLSLLFYILHTLVKGVLRTHFWQLGHLG